MNGSICRDSESKRHKWPRSSNSQELRQSGSIESFKACWRIPFCKLATTNGPTWKCRQKWTNQTHQKLNVPILGTKLQCRNECSDVTKTLKVHKLLTGDSPSYILSNSRYRWVQHPWHDSNLSVRRHRAPAVLDPKINVKVVLINNNPATILYIWSFQERMTMIWSYAMWSSRLF